MTIWLLLALGGAAGAVARFTTAGWIYARAGAGFPWGTLVVNVMGSFLLGAALTGLAGTSFHAQLAALLAVGFLGDFTTFSTFAYEGTMLLRDRQWRLAAAYLLGTPALALAAVVAGMYCGTILGS